MKVDGLITELVKHYSNLSVDSIYGYRKVALMELPEGVIVEIDATSSVDVTISKQLMQHNAESKKVYMDGTKINPTKMSIKGHIDITKLADIQRLANDDVSVYVSLTKNMGGAHLSVGSKTLLGGGMRPAREAGDVGDSLIEYHSVVESDTKEYVIQNLNISDNGFRNTVEVTVDLVEVVLFDDDYKSTYKFGPKPSTGAQIAGDKPLTEEKAKKYIFNGDGTYE